MTDKEIGFLNNVRNALYKLSKAHSDLERLWSNDQLNGVDLNDILTEDYPFDLSFNELPVQEWVINCNSKLLKLINGKEINNPEAG